MSERIIHTRRGKRSKHPKEKSSAPAAAQQQQQQQQAQGGPLSSTVLLDQLVIDVTSADNDSLLYVPPLSLDSGYAVDASGSGGDDVGGLLSILSSQNGGNGVNKSNNNNRRSTTTQLSPASTTSATQGGVIMGATSPATVGAVVGAGGGGEQFVTQPPKLLKNSKGGLTGKISTLFRRSDHQQNQGASSVASSSMSLSPRRGLGFRDRRRRHRSGTKGDINEEEEEEDDDSNGSSDADDEHTRPDGAAVAAVTAAAAGAGAAAPATSSGGSSSRRRSTNNNNNNNVTSKRIFYSSNCDDDSDDSYESRMSRQVQSGISRQTTNTYTSRGRSTNTSNTSTDIGGETSLEYTSRGTSYGGEDSDGDEDEASRIKRRGKGGGSSGGGGADKTILRYRGFSTSIKSLFLDEALVCASMGCFGLILSNRTEYLLQIRNERRGTLSPASNKSTSSRSGSSSTGGSAGGIGMWSTSDRRKLPSRVVAYGLILTILLMFSTFIIWGFGTGDSLASDYYTGYDYYNEQNSGSNNGNDGSGGDDAYNNNAAANDDGAAAADDDGYQNNNDGYNNNNNNNNQNDDANYNNGYNYANNYNNINYNGNNDDDSSNNWSNYWKNYWSNYWTDNNEGDDAVQGDDDGAAAAANDDGAAANDDGAAAKDDDDDYYAANDDDYNKERSLFKTSPSKPRSTSSTHAANGIFKLREYQEHLWNPVCEFLQNEWYRDDDTNSIIDAQRRHKQQIRQRERRQQSTSSSSYDSVEQQQDIGANIRIALLFAFLLFLGILGRRRRMRTRFYLVRARAQEDHLYYASSNVGQKRVAFEDTRENQYEGACSHTLCGCYPVNESTLEEEAHAEQVEVSDAGIHRRKKKPHHEDIVARCFNCFMASCCGVLCKCWFQCLSICALAQEAREIRLLLPPRYQRIDFITHQPFAEYQQQVTNLRLGYMGKMERLNGFMPHYVALSRLSRYIVFVGSLAVLSIVLTLMFNPRAGFSWQDAVVLAATFLQSFLVLFFVHWIFHKSDLSLDAVIKLFAAGFLIAVPTAFFFEGLLVNIVLFGAWGVYEFFAVVIGEPFIEFIFNHWRVVWILGELFNAYVVAAITEELCKYYTFRGVEHPDLVFLSGLDREQQGQTAVDGGLVKYPFGSHQVQMHNRVDNVIDDVSGSAKSHRSKGSFRAGTPQRKRGKDPLLEPIGEMDDDAEFKDEVQDIRTYRQKAMAITTGMISVAVGLACAENFLYVFVLGGALANSAGAENQSGDILEAWIVLLFRSIFPVHALSAAMQSINMIRKFVETSEDSGHRIGVGRIILPAVIVHGSFDAVLMGINVFVETAWYNYLEEHDGNIVEGEQPYNPVVLNLVAWISITAVMVAGIFWYYTENRKQRIRLKHLEDMEMTRRAASSPTSVYTSTIPGLSPVSTRWTATSHELSATSTGTSITREVELV